MPRITPISWRRFEKFLFFVGCTFKRERGDHRVYWRDGLKRPIIVPRDQALPTFIIRNNLHLLGISQKEYLNILDEL